MQYIKLIGLLFLITIYFNNSLWCHDRIRISGYIYDCESKKPLPFVQVYVKNDKTGDLSNIDGHYDLSVPSDSEVVVIFSLVGYKAYKKELKCNKNTKFDILLTPTIIMMQGISITAQSSNESKLNKSISSMPIDIKHIENFPFSLNDFNRVFKTLPGITSNNGMNSQFNVRGGTFDENMYRLDGIEISAPFHMKVAPNVSLSIINTNMIQSANLITGGFPAQYGNKLSSVVDISLRDGSDKKFKNQTEIGSIKLNTLFEGPIGKNATWIVGFNKSYFELPMKLMEKYHLVPKFYEAEGIPQYLDIQGKIKYKLNENDYLSFIFLFSEDNYLEDPGLEISSTYYWKYNDYSMQVVPSDSSYFNGSYSNLLSSVKFVNYFNPDFISNFVVSFSKESENINSIEKQNFENILYDNEQNELGYGLYSATENRSDDINIGNLTLKSEFKLKYNLSNEIDFGIQYRKIFYDNKLLDWFERNISTDFENFYYPPEDSIDVNSTISIFKIETYHTSAYIQDNWQVTDNLFLNLGIRFSYFDVNKNDNISPRISGYYNVGENLTLNIAWGHYFQTPRYYDLKYQYSTHNNPKCQKAEHYIIGIRQKLTEVFELKIDGYYKKYDNLISIDKDLWRNSSSQVNDTRGYAKGFDIQGKFNFGTFRGWISYAYLIAKENNMFDDLGYYPRHSDQRHTFATLLNWDISHNFKLNGKFLYGSGFPYTSKIFDQENLEFINGEKNSSYLPPYLRMDLRFGYGFDPKWGHIDFYLEIINILNHKNIYMYKSFYLDELNNLKKEPRYLLPFLPNFGIKICYN